MGKIRDLFIIVIWKPERNRQLGRSRSRGKVNRNGDWRYRAWTNGLDACDTGQRLVSGSCGNGNKYSYTSAGIYSQTEQVSASQKNSILNEINCFMERTGTMGTYGKCLNSLCCMAVGRL